MNLDSKTYSKPFKAYNPFGGSAEYIRILDAILSLTERHDYETPEMWCSRIRDPFRKIFEENSRILSKNGYIIIYGKMYENDKVHSHPTDYIYCSVCDSLVFIPRGYVFNHRNQDNHLMRCISGNSISNEHARRKEILESIDTREFQIWQYKQYILREEAKINRLHLELLSQSTSHSEKDKMASVSYDHDANFTASYENYIQSKFEPACISPTRQEMVSPISHQSSSDTGELFISSLYAKQPKGTTLRLRDGRVLTVV